jgi:Domain of unknown function (DUF4253)
MEDLMKDIWNDPWPFVVGLALVSAIYFATYIVIPFLFRNVTGSKTAQQIANSKIIAKAVDVVKPKPMFGFEVRAVPGESAMAAFEAAKTKGKGVPVIIGGDEHMVQSLADMMAYLKPTPAEYIRKAEAKPNPYPAKSPPKMPKLWPRVGPFDNERNPFAIHLHPEGFKPIVTIAHIPAQSSADIPAYLKLGSWNAVPDADIFVALLRKWQSEYGAELVALTMDTLDIRVTRRPTTQQEALVLAREHAKFCPSNEVTIAERAAELMLLDWWHFWWD